jgi:L-seryl-tRNA(Ser) seleniumtransferase
MSNNPLRQLPSVNQVLQNPSVVALVATFGHDAVADTVRETLERCRERSRNGEILDTNQLIQQVTERISVREAPKLRPVINATGVLLHTNLGRAPLADAAVQAAADAAKGYLNLELELETGKRSQRHHAVREWLCRLLGCESATVVNNCAAATVLVLRAFASGREVIVSRGQLVEIGGSFRIPDIMATSGAVLREIGTTNITRIEDYQRAITPETAMILRVHQSNYRVHGFTESPSLEELVALSRKRRVLFMDDIGSGAIVDYSRFGLPGEPLAAESIRAGADLVLFSGDKLLGGPQAGIIAGRKDLIEIVEKDPLMRAFRLDKMTLAALEATLRLYLRPHVALAEIPVLRQLNTSMDELRGRANRIADALRSAMAVEVRDDETFVGGGSLPDQSYPTVVVTLSADDGADAMARRLRAGDPPVLGRVQGGHVLLDLRSVLPGQIDLLIAAVLCAKPQAA